LYDWHTDGFKRQIPASVESFRTLIDLCIHPHTSTDFVNLFATSVIVHFTEDQSNIYNELDAREHMKEFYTNPTFNTFQHLSKVPPLNLFTIFNDYWENQQHSLNTPLSLLITTIKQDRYSSKFYQVLSNLLNQSGENYNIALQSLLDFVGKHMESAQLYLRDFGGQLNGMKHMITALGLLKIHDDTVLKALYHKVIHGNGESDSVPLRWAVSSALCLLLLGFTDSNIEDMIAVAVKYESDSDIREEGLRGASIICAHDNNLNPIPVTSQCSQPDLCQWTSVKDKYIGVVDSQVNNCLLDGKCSFVTSGKGYPKQWYFPISSDCYCLMCYNSCIPYQQTVLKFGGCYCDCKSEVCLHRST
jgi:hypothetical protein